MVEKVQFEVRSDLESPLDGATVALRDGSTYDVHKAIQAGTGNKITLDANKPEDAEKIAILDGFPALQRATSNSKKGGN